MSLLRLNAGFLGVWTLLLILCWLNSYDDPSSIFYDEERGVQLRYSRQRAAEADVFLRNIPPKPRPDRQQLLCIGVPSINRTTQSFLPHTLATLTDALTAPERASIHLVVLLADRPSDHHSAYGQEWLERIADEVLVYDETPTTTGNSSSIYRSVPFNLVPNRTRGDGRVENMRLDHSVLVETCRDHAADFFVLIEDDIIASRDWFTRLKTGLAYVEARTSETKQEWIYLRLFFSELLMGWNSEEWLSYATHVFAAYAVALLLFLAARKHFRLGAVAGAGSAQTYRYLTALAFGLWLPALIALYFLAGRVSARRINPFARWSPPPGGVREMPNYGCCAQGLVFPRRQIDGLFGLMRSPPYDFPGDMILEGYAGDRGLKKWALDPSVFQHVGITESSEGPRRADVWNFSFERTKPGGT